MTEAAAVTNQLQKCLRRWRKEAWRDKNDLDEVDGSTGLLLDYQKFKRENSAWLVEEDEETETSNAARLRKLEELCDKGANLQYLELERGFALIPHVHWSQELIKFFLDRGVDINSRDEKGNTALHLAFDLSESDANSESDSENDFSLSSIEKNFSPIKKPVKLIKFLLEHGADPNVTNLRGENALFTLAKRGLASLIRDRKDTLELANQFRKRGAEVATPNVDGETLLHVLSSKWRKLLNDAPFNEALDGTDVDVRTSTWLYSKTPLMLAASSGSLENCKLFLERGADVNAVDLQGYTSLHHAAFEDCYWQCVKYLIEMGANPNLKSSSGRKAYDFCIYHLGSFGDIEIGLAAPAEQVVMYEMVGAGLIIKNSNASSTNRYAISLWDQAKKVSKKFKLPLSQEFRSNYKFLKRNLNNEDAREEIYQSAMNSVVRLSPESTSKVWNLITFAPDILDSPLHFLKIYFDFLSDELSKHEVVEDLASFEESDFKSLKELVSVMDCCLRMLIGKGEKTEMATIQSISQVQKIARLTIACFKKLMHATHSKKVSDTCVKLYVTLCHVLVIIHSQFDGFLSEDALKDTEPLLKSLLNMDLRNKDGDPVIHLILQDLLHTFNYFITAQAHHDQQSNVRIDSDVKIEFPYIDFHAKNSMGFEPVQMIKAWADFKSMPLLEVIVKMAERGGHLDVRNYWGEPTLKQVFDKVQGSRPDLVFRFDSLQCACARVLAKSLVPFRNNEGVPKAMIDFILSHNVH